MFALMSKLGKRAVVILFAQLRFFLVGHFEVWTVMFNTMCPAELAARGAYAVWEGNLCSGTEAGSWQDPVGSWFASQVSAHCRAV